MGLVFRLTDKHKHKAAFHAAGCCVASYRVGVGLTKRGATIRECKCKEFAHGFAHVREVGLNCSNSKRREFFLKQAIVVAFAGLIAEYMMHRKSSSGGVDTIRWALGELLAQRESFVDGWGENDPHWIHLPALVLVQASSKNLEQALERMDEYYTSIMDNSPQSPPIDTEVFHILWPLAERARHIIDTDWSSVKRLASELADASALGREQIVALLPWAGEITLS